MPYGYKFQIGIQRVTEPDPNRRRGVAAPVLMAAFVAFALLAVAWAIWPRAVPVESAPLAHVAPVPTATATATARPTSSPVVVHVTEQTGAVCILPGGKTINPVELAEVP